MKTKHIVVLGSFLLALVVFEASAFYDPGLQRWINRDPLGEWGGKNLYQFVRNQPTAFVDPVGLDVIGRALALNQRCQYYRCKYAMYQQRDEIMGRAWKESRQKFGGYGFDGGPEDTFRHCLAGCYLAKAMHETSSCGMVPPEAFIREEEMNRSANKSQVDINNGLVGAQAPANANCQSYCLQAMADGRAKNEKPGPYPLPKP